MANCSTHSNRLAVSTCNECGKPICQGCYNDFNIERNGETAHLCSNCYKDAIISEIAEVKSLKRMVRREFILIIIGLIVGLYVGLDIYFGIGIITDQPTHVILAPIYLPFIIGSLMTIIKRIHSWYEATQEDSDNTNWLAFILIVLFQLLIAPITTIVRFFQRIGDMHKLNRIASQGESALTAVDNHIRQSLRPSFVEQAAEGGAGDVEVPLEAVLAFGGSDAALCDNGEILRTIRSR